MDRRAVLRAAACIPACWLGFDRGVLADTANLGQTAPLRVAMTPFFLHEQHRVLEQWRDYMVRNLGRPVEFIVRDSYRETMDLFRLNQLEFSWICDYPYLHLRRLLRLVAVPRFRGKPKYQSYLIVSSKDTTTMTIRDLRGALFAFADPYSNTGYLVPRYQLHLLGENAKSFFGKSFFTYGHRRIIEAVATGLADGGAVDSFIWETMAELAPELVRRTRVAWRSPEFGFPPLVSHRELVSDELHVRMQRMLIAMQDDTEGKLLLKRLNIDGFGTGSPDLYEGVAEMMRALGEYDPA